jgi:hypothetical protein
MCGASILSSSGTTGEGPAVAPPYHLSDSYLVLSGDGSRIRHLSTAAAAYGSVDDPFITVRGLERVVSRDCPSDATAAAHQIIQLLNARFSTSDFFNHTPCAYNVMRSLLTTLCTFLTSELGGPHNSQRHTVYLQSPVVVCGDLHGSYADLSFFLRSVTPFGSPTFLHSPILFLGDYVDRGAHSVEVVALLFAWRVLCPNFVVLLRGNHEDPEVNGDIRQYSEGSFLHKCVTTFGEEHGPSMWARVNAVFSHLPVASVIDGRVFACHGGIPRLMFQPDAFASGSVDVEMFRQLLNNDERFPLFDTVLPVAEDLPTRAQQRRLIREIMWNDPAPAENSPTAGGYDTGGFRPNYGRGDAEGIILEFSPEAVKQFLSVFGWSNILRAHQHKQSGLQLSEGAAVVTVFSASNYSGGVNSAGACLVSAGTLHLVSWSKAAALRAISPSHSPTRTSASQHAPQHPPDASQDTYIPDGYADRHSEVPCFMSADSDALLWSDGRLPTTMDLHGVGGGMPCQLGAGIHRTATLVESISHAEAHLGRPHPTASSNPMRDLWSSLCEGDWSHSAGDEPSPDWQPTSGHTRDIYVSSQSIRIPLVSPSYRSLGRMKPLMAPTLSADPPEG